MIIKIDISNVFNSTCRVLTLDILSWRASRDHVCGLMRGDMLLPPTRPYLTCLDILKPYVCDMLNYDTLTGTDRFTFRRAKQEDIRGSPSSRDVSIQFDYPPFMGTCSLKVSRDSDGWVRGWWWTDGYINDVLKVSLGLVYLLVRTFSYRTL